MFCPECGAQYREGIVTCADCEVPLVARLPEESHEGPDLDTVIQTGMRDPVAIGLAKSLFEEAGIPYFVMDQNLAARQESGNILGWVRIRVPREREAEAREILESVAHPKDLLPES